MKSVYRCVSKQYLSVSLLFEDFVGLILVKTVFGCREAPLEILSQ